MSSLLQARTCCPLLSPGYPMFFMSIGPNSERKWRKSKDPSDLSIYQSLLSSFSAEVHTAKASYFHNKINSTSDTRNLFKILNSLLCLSTLSSLDITGFHFAGLNPISMAGLSRWPGEGRYPQNINWSLGFPRARFLDPPLLHIHCITGSHHTGTWLLLPFLR